MVKIDGSTGIDTIQDGDVMSADLATSIALTGIPTAPTAPAGTNTTQLATTAFAYGSLWAYGNGYQKLPSGLIIQWGMFDSSGPYNVITLPVAFPNDCHSAFATATFNGDYTARIMSITATSITVNVDNSNIDFYWLAIGN
jgi:hypothetical protein